MNFTLDEKYRYSMMTDDESAIYELYLAEQERADIAVDDAETARGRLEQIEIRLRNMKKRLDVFYDRSRYERIR